jgi:acetoin utilization deacetylase AcuC-like enzyme
MLFFTHSDCDQHITPPGHPERVERLAAVRRAAAALGIGQTPCPMGDEADIRRVHPQSHIDGLRAALPRTGWAQIDGDTVLSPGSLTAALRAVGGATAAVDAVIAGQTRTAFVACRPPGHHAETATAMGFCLFGTVAIAAKRALDHHGLTRVAIVDFDVHHGNGTQDLLWDEARCLYVSSHQMPLYPGTGSPVETGTHGQILNIPLAGGTGGAAMRAAYEAQVFPRLRAFDAQLLLISAGFDAHEDDPLAGLNWQADDYGWLTERLCQIGAGRVVSCLEGGYDLAALESSVAAHLAVLKEKAHG